MAFSYAAGSTTPGIAGLIEWPSLRVNDVIGGTAASFHALEVPPLLDSAPIRVSSAASPEGGGVVGDPKLDVWPFEVICWIYTDDVADIQAGIDYLKSKVNAWKGFQTVTLNAQGWAEGRTMSLQLNGQISVGRTDKGAMVAPERIITIPVIAADPRMYGATGKTATVTTSTSVTNDGNYGAPFKVRFNGPQTDPYIDKDGTSGSQRIKYTGAITSGHWVEVDTRDGSAVDDTGASALGDGTNGVSRFSARTLPTGSSSWTKGNASGAGSTTFAWNDTFA